MKQKIDKQLVRHIAELAQIPITAKEEESLANDFAATLKVVDQLQKVDAKGVKLTYQVTGLKNITREDEVNKKNMFTQKQALINASHTYDGFFVVKRVIDAK
ncbi:Asp-tRNA(Asn)/Glu-tRNA(Gln) amidotransferase subunit GatC [Patescibacteria group bacterium]|nr:Asp-tRNA(Asn)/Glu-tRNA(Gln) amidotransferase subunit GatC [Patescibacteria group bacterium]MBU1885859.1 Asp-tRNA(Asn)/Glu-tRNA(Gln) amidotransferase subunit GatC [Patescibacteria group bacterium]